MIKRLKDLKNLNVNAQLKKIKCRDMGIAAAFVFSITLLLIVAGYVISRLAKDHAYREKWRDYNDCGWA